MRWWDYDGWKYDTYFGGLVYCQYYSSIKRVEYPMDTLFFV
jgi:hypothetical protein